MTGAQAAAVVRAMLCVPVCLCVNCAAPLQHKTAAHNPLLVWHMCCLPAWQAANTHLVNRTLSQPTQQQHAHWAGQTTGSNQHNNQPVRPHLQWPTRVTVSVILSCPLAGSPLAAHAASSHPSDMLPKSKKSAQPQLSLVPTSGVVARHLTSPAAMTKPAS